MQDFKNSIAILFALSEPRARVGETRIGHGDVNSVITDHGSQESLPQPPRAWGAMYGGGTIQMS